MGYKNCPAAANSSSYAVKLLGRYFQMMFGEIEGISCGILVRLAVKEKPHLSAVDVHEAPPTPKTTTQGAEILLNLRTGGLVADHLLCHVAHVGEVLPPSLAL